MIEFNTREKVNEFLSCPGNQFENLFDSQVQKDGSVKLVISGKKDIRQEIDSWREQTDMQYILRAMAAGTYQEREGGMYGDFTKLPATIQDAMQLMLDAERAFYDLPYETRNKFDNDYKKWLVMANQDTANFSKLMGFVNAAAQDPSVVNAAAQDPSGSEKTSEEKVGEK